MNDGGANAKGIVDRLTLLSELLCSFSAATTDYPTLLDTVAVRTASFLGHAISIRLLTTDGHHLVGAGAFDPIDGSSSPLLTFHARTITLYENHPFTENLRIGRANLTTYGADELTGLCDADLHEGLRALRIRGVALAPLRAGNETLGVMFVIQRGESEPLEHADLELVEAIASHAAIAISKARMLSELTKQTRERKRAEDSLTIAEVARAYKRSIIDTVFQPLIVLDATETVRSANKTFYDTFATKERDVVGSNVFEIAGRALDTPRMRALLAEVLPVRSGDLVANIQIDLTIAERGPRKMIVNARKMYRPGNGSDTILIAFDDVTERSDASEKLLRRALLLESMSEAVIAGTVDFVIQEWNPAAERLFGWTAEEACGKCLHHLLPIQDIDRYSVHADVTQGQTSSTPMRVRHRLGRWLDIEVSSMPVMQDGKSAGFVCVMKDVGDRIRLERELKQRLLELEVANQDLESFSYSVSHDLRAPVRAIEGFARLLGADHGSLLDEEGTRLLGVVRKNAQRMGQLIDELLAFSKLGRQALATTRIEMDPMVRELVDDVRRVEPPRDYEIVVAALPDAMGDRVLVGQVWTNLLTNAVKYTRGRTPAVIEIRGETREGEVIYSVRDNGVGFDMQYVSKIFGVFERLHVDSEFEGTGVGLALVERIVKRHGGRVWADGVPEKGATFFFSLPNGERLA